jgi:transposase InsO family protein
MGWREVSVTDQRREFVALASLEGANVSALCRRFGISRQTGHLWLRRAAAGATSFEDRSRRPLSSPRQMAPSLEGEILKVRQAHPAWGARKIAAVLARTGIVPPAPSTVHAALVRAGLIDTAASRAHAYGRFEHPEPNALWQMDFKGKVKLDCGTWCHPLTVLDDHSRYAVGLMACADQRTATVRAGLEMILRQHGLPEAISVDNGSPWGGGQPGLWTPLRVWLLKLGVQTIHGTPYHPQGRGKCERFHRSLAAEVFAFARLRGLAQTQAALTHWRHVYNRQRPHEALGLQPPACRYRVSARPFPERLSAPDYASGEIVRKVLSTKAYISFANRLWRVPQAFAGEYVAVRPRLPEGRYGIFFGATEIARLNLNQPDDHTDEV